MYLLFVHACLASLLFLAVQWISRHSGWWGYKEIGLAEEEDGAPAHNVVFRVLAPLVFSTVTAALWYALKLDWVVQDYYQVTVLYIAGRLAVVLLLGQARLVRWGRQAITSGATIALAFGLYEGLLRHRRNLLPDPANLTNELWIVVILFLYQTSNRVQWPGASPEQLARRYVSRRFIQYQRRYGQILEQELPDLSVRVLAYAVMIYESFNRPPVVQWIERSVLARFRNITSLGPMQVRTSEKLSAEDSVRAGAQLLRGAFEAALQKTVSPQSDNGAHERDSAQLSSSAPGHQVAETAPALDLAHQHQVYSRGEIRALALSRYNIRSDYPQAVERVYAQLILEHFPHLAAAELYYTVGDLG